MTSITMETASDSPKNNGDSQATRAALLGHSAMETLPTSHHTVDEFNVKLLKASRLMLIRHSNVEGVQNGFDGRTLRASL